MTRNDLPFATLNAGTIRITITPDNPKGYSVESEVYQAVHCPDWADMIDTLQEQRDALADTELPVVATYYPNESALSARVITIP